MKNLTYDRPKHEDYYLSNSQIDESVLTKKHYVLADFTTRSGQAYAINVNNNFAYPIIGKRFNKKMKAKYPQLPDARCMTKRAISLEELNRS